MQRVSREDGTTFNQFVTIVVADTVSAVETARFFTDRKARSGFDLSMSSSRLQKCTTRLRRGAGLQEEPCRVTLPALLTGSPISVCSAIFEFSKATVLQTGACERQPYTHNR